MEGWELYGWNVHYIGSLAMQFAKNGLFMLPPTVTIEPRYAVMRQPCPTYTAYTCKFDHSLLLSTVRTRKHTFATVKILCGNMCFSSLVPSITYVYSVMIYQCVAHTKMYRM
jgi:hypothetical protein